MSDKVVKKNRRAGINKVDNLIKKGREGRNWGLPMGLPKLEGELDGVTQGTYYLIGGGTGSGKTSFMINSYVYEPVKDIINKKRERKKLLESGQHPGDIIEDIKIIYFSLEMNEEQLLLKLLSLYLYDTYGIELSFKELISRKKNYILSDEDYDRVEEAYDWLDEVLEHLVIYDKALSSASLYKFIMEQLQMIGKFVETDSRKIYYPDNPYLIFEVILDHAGLLNTKEGRSLKEEIDLTSSYLVTLRERCQITPIVLSQFNRDLTNMDRRNGGMEEPELRDFKNTGNLSEDCTVALTLYSPFKNKVTKHRGYDIKILQDKYISIACLKNRWGESNYAIGCGFFGKIGKFLELPRADEIYDYEKYTTLDGFKKKDEIKKTTFNITL